VRVVQVLLLCAFAGLSLRAAHLSVIDRRGLERGQDQTDRALHLVPHRGLIVDRSGAELAVTLSAPSVYALPAALEDRAGTAERLARALSREAGPLQERLAKATRFTYVARWVTAEQAERVRELELPGIGVLDEPRRVYPHRGLAAQIVGFANIDGDGVRGVEQQEDAWLRGAPQRIRVERDNRGHLLLPGGVDPGESRGGDVALTLHAVLQADADRALEAALAETKARGGVVVTLDPRSGDVLAVAERPGFDPNAFREFPYSTTRARTFLDALEPGSTLKLFAVAGALDEGAVTPHQAIETGDGRFPIPGKVIRDRRSFGRLDPAGVLRVSSNIGATKIAYALGREAHYQALQAFGFGRPTGSGFPEESSGLLRPWSDWRPVDHATIAFGQGVSVTPIQLAAATAALANDGVWRRPRLVLARRGRDGVWAAAPPAPAHRAVGADTARAVLEMMTGVVGPEGTGRQAALRGVPVAGKTGTAQKLDARTGTYARDRYIAWFVGVVPANDPRLVVLAMLDEPGLASHTGGAAAAPLFAEVAAAQLRSLGIVTQPEPVEVRVAEAAVPRKAAAPREVSPKVQAPARPAPVEAEATAHPAAPARSAPPDATETRLAALDDRVLLPDFRGLSRADVERLTAGSALRLEMVGSGRAVAQDPDPGTILAANRERIRVSVRFAPEGH
jgi:cell division protein FtsI (penicillin-binding protein 3)